MNWNKILNCIAIACGGLIGLAALPGIAIPAAVVGIAGVVGTVAGKLALSAAPTALHGIPPKGQP